MAFKAFENDSQVLAIQGDAFTIENDPQRITLQGQLEIARDREGLKAALALKGAVDAIVAALQADKALPEKLDDAPPAATGSVENPF